MCLLWWVMSLVFEAVDKGQGVFVMVGDVPPPNPWSGHRCVKRVSVFHLRSGADIKYIRNRNIISFFFIYPGLQFKHYSLVSHRAPACNLDIAEHGNILITRKLLENF